LIPLLAVAFAAELAAAMQHLFTEVFPYLQPPHDHLPLLHMLCSTPVILQSEK
jgi:hypothetical protein